MTDTETRLRDYLDSMAATVPDEPPGLELTPRRQRHWPVALAAAAMVVIAVPVAIHLSDRDKATPPPPAETTGNELRLPYVLQGAGPGTLHDGKQTVTWPRGLDAPLGRVNGGWLTVQESIPSKIGVGTPDGRFRQIGPTGADFGTLSPDRSKVVMSHELGNGKTRIGVYSVAGGKELAAITLPFAPTIIWAWNQAGIWLGSENDVGAQPMLWQPSKGQPVQLSIPGFDASLVGATDTDKVQVVTRTDKGRAWCLKVGSVKGTGLAVDREYCGTGNQFSPTVSPDGRTMIYPGSSSSVDGKRTVVPQPVAIDVATGKVTKLRLPQEMPSYPPPVFEDDTHLIYTDTSVGGGTPPGQAPATDGKPVIRCEVTSGDCQLLFTTPEGVFLLIGRG
ncbi:hypothetical protein EV138_1027 [Kribbella voronezhensis]|uniref:WD40 repeat protein n=1 Tax=Kribbella voronezhensis TaxID=2512212 RepID=A0A4R7T6M6_9ACTN|nr:hypothetical protein [Kribbella voronezhensis]TDU87504.1 hypothetical protein EV138_1027 [Kribbella voronezhensis]